MATTSANLPRPNLYRSIRRAPIGPVARWFVPALLLTLGVHALLYTLVRRTHFEPLSPKFYNQLVPRTFNMQRVEIDPKLLDAAGAQPLTVEKVPTTPNPQPTDIQIPGDKPTFEQELARANEVIAAPKIAERTLALTDKPKVDSGADIARTLNEQPVGSEIPSDLNALRDSLLAGKPKVSRNHPAFNVTGAEEQTRANAGPNVGQPNFSNLEGLLSQRGPLTGREGPILLPTDLLFDYDAFQLRPDAAGSLEKLGQLIRQNPQATFIIDGHTDLYGSPEYNQTLSERRAASVKVWLVQNAGIDPARIATRGFGSRKPLVPGGSVEAQQLNRRVEIVIKTNKNR